MKAITLDSNGLHLVNDHPDPVADGNNIVVRVLQAGICETDVQLSKGYMGFTGVLGHEFVGIAQSGIHEQRRVVAEINCSCHQCETCRSGRTTHCPTRTVIGIDRRDGAFADQVAIPESNLHVVPNSVSDDHAVFVEPLAAAFEILTQIDVSSTDRVAVLGDGRLGYLCAQVLALHTKNLTVFGKHGTKLIRFGHRDLTTVQISSPDPQELPSSEFDIVVDCSGSTTGLPMALHLVRPRGTVVMKTTVADAHTLSLAAIVIDEVSLIGSRCGPFDRALQALEKQEIDVTDLITDRFSLSDFKTAFETADNPNSFKVVFDIGSESK